MLTIRSRDHEAGWPISSELLIPKEEQIELLKKASIWSKQTMASVPSQTMQNALPFDTDYVDSRDDGPPQMDSKFLPEAGRQRQNSESEANLRAAKAHARYLSGGHGSTHADRIPSRKALPSSEFVAVSYACGQDPCNLPILLQSCIFQLRKNLHDFLQEYTASTNETYDSKAPDRFSGDRDLLWIDALCIDQENVAERSQQVQIMSKIYTQASKVIAWLGVAADDSDWCFDRIEDMNAGRSVSLDRINHERSQYSTAFGLRLRDGVRAILKRPLFSRVWCVQELVLGPKVVLMCGAKTVGWDKFQSVANLFTFDFYTDYSRLESLRRTEGKMSMLSIPHEAGFETAFDTPRTAHERNTTRKLGNLLRCFIGRQCTIKHDYVYALIGIASDFDPVVDSGSGLTIDYAMPIEDLFDEVITFCVLRYEFDGLFIRKLAKAMELSETKMEQVMRMTERINSNVKADTKQLQAPRSSLEP